jgi:hypothetical protein
VEDVEMHEDFGAPVSSETEARISHFIPSVELKGSRYQKLQKLDMLIDYLERLRRSLAGDTGPTRGSSAETGWQVESSTHAWFTVGTLLAVLVVLLLFATSRAL